MRRELGLALALTLLGACGALVAAGRTWARGFSLPPPPLPPQALSVDGDGAVRALALVGLAGVVAVLAVRGRGRALVGVVLLLAGLGIVARAALFQSGLDRTVWPDLAAASGLVLAAAGALVAWRGRTWAALSQRYDAPAQRPVSAWDALDRGEDPTA